MDKIDIGPNSIETSIEKSYHSSQKWGYCLSHKG